MLKSAFLRSSKVLRTNSRDVEALHCVARVYLAQGMAGPAISCTKRALVLQPDDALLWITLSRCYLSAGWHTSASEAAERAVALGGTYGNEVLATACLLGDTTSDIDEVVARYERCREAITPAGREAYLGCSTDGRQALQALRAEQARRGSEVLARIKGCEDMDWGFDLPDNLLGDLDLDHDGISELSNGVLDVDHDGIAENAGGTVDLDHDGISELNNGVLDVNHDGIVRARTASLTSTMTAYRRVS